MTVCVSAALRTTTHTRAADEMLSGTHASASALSGHSAYVLDLIICLRFVSIVLIVGAHVGITSHRGE